MQQQKVLETIDAAIKALTELEHAIKQNNPRIVSMQIQFLWVELSNLREMVENMKDEDN